jgi:hypothetical protein
MNKKKLKMRITKRKNPKAVQKRKNRKKLGRMVAPVHFDPKILAKALVVGGRIIGSEAAVGGGARSALFSVAMS